ncbi:MAG: alkaline phosphatase [Gemmatimonadota bacterium]|jgi:alkaline phosphatase
MSAKASVLALVFVAACAAAVPNVDAGSAPSARPKSVILMIGDGTGVAYWSAARLARKDLAVADFPVMGLVDTQSSDARVTDSAAGATAFASGVRTYNGAIGVSPDTTPMETVLEMARDQGKATGLVATSRINHATPAAFAAHVRSRQMYDRIARQMAGAGVTVMVGGGSGYFDGTARADSQNLLATLGQQYTVVMNPTDFLALDPDTVQMLLGLLVPKDMPAATGRTITLGDMTRTTLAVLDHDPDGFFVMVEGSEIDWMGHDNAPLEDVVAEVLDFDGAIREARRYQASHRNTLIVVLADHETGGLALHDDDTGAFGAHYTTTGHTEEMIPLFAAGPGAQRFAGIHDNDEVGRILMDLTTGRRPTPVPLATGR